MKAKYHKTNEIKDDLLPEYDLDYSKAMPNKFAEMEKRILIELDNDVAEVFNESSKINNVLRAIIKSIPKSKKNRTQAGKKARLKATIQ